MTWAIHNLINKMTLINIKKISLSIPEYQCRKKASKNTGTDRSKTTQSKINIRANSNVIKVFVESLLYDCYYHT
jgi:hypothetical protein